MEYSGKAISGFALSLKEFKICASLTLAYIAISCLISYFLGYNSATDVQLWHGIPIWALLGVIVPWVLMVVITIVYSFFIMEGDTESC